MFIAIEEKILDMTAITFKMTEMHGHYDYYFLFSEPWDRSRTNEDRIKGWTFELQETDMQILQKLCDKYNVNGIRDEVFCIFRKLKDSVTEADDFFEKNEWQADIAPYIDAFDKWRLSTNFKMVFDLDSLEYVKVKHKDKKSAYTYDGILMDFIRQAVLEKIERDDSLLKKMRFHIVELAINVKRRMPSELRESERSVEKLFAWGINNFLKNEYVRGKAGINLNQESIDKFGAELMKISGIKFPVDKEKITNGLEERKMNFRSWRIAHEKTENR